jgi:hypothetical protein
MGFSIEKCLKIDEPLGTVYQSTEPHPIKSANTAPSDDNRDDEIAIETAKTGKVAAVVAGMSIFCKKKCKSRIANCRNEELSHQKVESARIKKPFLENEKRLVTKKLASKSKKLELNSTNLKLKSKKTQSDRAKKPDPSISNRLKVKNKTIRVLLHSRSSGDLLFRKKGPVNTSPLCRELSLSRGALPMAPSSQTR